MRAPGDILLLSTYELGHQPAGLAVPLAFLERAGFRPRALDLAVEPLDEDAVRSARLVALSTPMHTALRLGLQAAARVRALAPGAVLCFHGLYAPLHAALLREAGAAAVLGGECEEELVALARALERGEPLDRFVHHGAAEATRAKLDFPVPSRAALPPPGRYARLADASGERLAGHVEATRGCRHLCRHCPIPPVYGGRLFAIPVEAVVADATQQIAAGVRHLTFGDPDFLNGPAHALRVARALHARLPAVTFDFTAKVSHLVKHAALLPELAACGANFCVSAVESLSDRVLRVLDKGHTRDDVLRAFAACADAGISLRPSLLPFTPWSTLDDVVELVRTFLAEGWADHTDPVQLSIRLLVPEGSLLLGEPGLDARPYDPATLGHPWRHADPRMDALQRSIARRVEEAALAGDPPRRTFEEVLSLALAAAGRPHEHVRARRSQHSGRDTPRLTESWFC